MSDALGPAGDLPGEPSCVAAPGRGVNGPSRGVEGGTRAQGGRAPVALVRVDDELLAVMLEALAGYRRAILAAGRPLPGGLEPLLCRLILCARRRQTLVLREPVAEGGPVALLDLDQAASLSRLSRRTLQRRIAAGDLRARRSGRRVLVHPDDLAAHLDPCGPEAA